MKKSVGPKPLIYPTPVFLIGSYDKTGQPNIMTVSWGGICCSEPPCVAISLRAETATYHNVLATKAFTVNLPSEGQVKEADYLGIVSGRDEDKFAKVRWTPVPSVKVNAPYIDECSLILECAVKDVIKIGLHTQFIGEIKDIKADADVLTKEGVPDIEKIKPFMFAPILRKYYSLGPALGKAFTVGKKK